MANKQMAFYIDLDSCSGCKACQIACKDKNNLEVGRMFRRVAEYQGGDWVRQGKAWISTSYVYHISTSCMHCANPPCVAACPAAAITKRAEDGIVVIDGEKCIGCRYCEWACPYGAPHYDEANKQMTKCDFCQDLLAEGQSPACVAACPLRILDYGDLEELKAKYGTNLQSVTPLPDPSMAGPSIVFKPHHSSRVTFDAGEVGNKEEM